MKNLLPLITLFPFLLVVGCDGKYPSMKQAEVACSDWWDTGKEIKYKVWSDKLQGGFDSSAFNRKCELEEATNQYLGYQGKFSEEEREKAGKMLEFSTMPFASDYKVVKNFRY